MLKVLEVNVDDHLNGGVYVLVRDLIKRLPQSIKADIAALERFDVPEHIERLKEYGCDVHYVGYGGNKIFKQFKIYKNVKDLIRDKGYDVVHIHSDVSHKLLVSALAAKKAGVKRIILHSHANDVEGRHKTLRRCFHKMGLLRLKKIRAEYLATSLDAGKWMFPWVKEDQLTILDNGVDYDRFAFNDEVRKRIRKKLNAEQRFVIGMVGRFVYQKNVFYALEIMKELYKKCEDVYFVCVGDGPLKEPFIDMAKEMGLKDVIHMAGTLDNVEDYYQAFDVFIMPSSFEGFGLAAVEAQVSGTPVVASVNVPEMTRISDIINYLPVGESDISRWAETIISYRSFMKHSVSELDRKYDISNFVLSLVNLYEGDSSNAG